MKVLISILAMCIATFAMAGPGALVYEEPCEVFDYYTDGDWVHFEQSLGAPFDQVMGNTYWISIQGIFSQTGNRWDWQWCDPADYWGFEGELRSDYFGFPDWVPISDAAGSYFELAFVLHGASGAEKWRQNPYAGNAIISSVSPDYLDGESADDFYCADGDPIVHIEWWGWLSDPIPDYFMIRFYLDDSVTAIDESTWSNLKTLY